MCVQIGVDFTWERLREELAAATADDEAGWLPQEVLKGYAQPSIPAAWTAGDGGRTLRLLRWGFAAHADAKPHLNARRETLAAKPTFAAAAQTGRCLLPVSCWHEWRRNGRKREPYRLAAKDGRLLTFAGVRSGGSCAVVTVPAAGVAAWVHNTGLRMPLIIEPAARAAWLDADFSELAALASSDASDLEATYLSQEPRQGELV
ncbi:MAG: SOS response-associated peptidase family protein [Betaproteobacteria bacterium AqS2]|uniref:Abasic site processing protein n=1 Tax=Candidatus Amphirhobacter heronislandensis TaxID=1732024 RepID=A0A930UGG9_9GAMM|nr:SOS response-associated peptidase family protein [Betaproteobacteria bacterium AqS2]